MRRRGSFDKSDYNWVGVASAAAYLLMDQGAQPRPLTTQEIADHLANHHRQKGDARRAAYQIEGHEDIARGWYLLAEQAVKGMLRAKVIREQDGGYVWVSERLRFTSHGRKIDLYSAEERVQADRQKRVENLGLGRPFSALPKRIYDPEKMGVREREEYEELKENIKTFGYDPNFPILVNEDGEIISGRSRKMICDELGIEPRYVKVSRTVSGQPLRNLDDLMRAARANMGRGLSTETRNAVAQQMREQGVTQQEIATALGMTQGRVSQVTSPTAALAANGAAPAERKLDDETAISALMELLRENPDRGARATAAVLRERKGVKIGDHRVDRLAKVAKSRLAGKVEPEPQPEPPEHEHVWITVCAECGEQHA